MQRVLALAAIVALFGCTGSQRTAPDQAADSDPSHHVNYEPAPMTDPLDYHMPPDARDEMCSRRQPTDRNNSFATITKATTSYYCF